jgi:hypothetical protein
VPPEPSYTTFEEAVAQGAARVTEVGGRGSVREVRFENLRGKPVLLLDERRFSQERPALVSSETFSVITRIKLNLCRSVASPWS